MNSIRSPLLSLAFGLVASTVQAADPPGMVWVPGGEFVMGTDDKKSMPNERPAHRVYVDGFWMDATIVTNANQDRVADQIPLVNMSKRTSRLL